MNAEPLWYITLRGATLWGYSRFQSFADPRYPISARSSLYMERVDVLQRKIQRDIVLAVVVHSRIDGVFDTCKISS